jgi:DNA-binding LacI/PurR family transcriptional regulator
MARYAQIAQALHTRIRHGDYRVREFPSLTALAVELGVNPRTVMKAVNELLDNGVLQRLSTGRIAVNEDLHQPGERHIVLLTPAYPSLLISLWYQAILRLTEARQWKMKLVSYSHWEDPSIAMSLRGFDACFFMPGGSDIPRGVLKLITDSAKPVVVLDHDTTAAGIPCLRFAASMAIPNLLDLLTAGGHRSVACFNTQPMDPVIRERIDHWTLWTHVHSAQGELIDDHVRPFESAVERATEAFGSILDQGKLKSTAVFCTTGSAAVGAVRALADHGMRAGREIAICCADDLAGIAPYLCPSLTCIRDPEWDPYLQVCLDWFAKDDNAWVGPLMVHPAEMPIFVGESTGNKK